MRSDRWNVKPTVARRRGTVHRDRRHASLAWIIREIRAQCWEWGPTLSQPPWSLTIILTSTRGSPEQLSTNAPMFAKELALIFNEIISEAFHFSRHRFRRNFRFFALSVRHVSICKHNWILTNPLLSAITWSPPLPLLPLLPPPLCYTIHLKTVQCLGIYNPQIIPSN